MKQNKQVKRVKTLKAIEIPHAIEKEFIKKLKALSKEVNNSIFYWTKARFNANINKNISKQLIFELNALDKEWQSRILKQAKGLSKWIIKEVKGYVNANLIKQNKDFAITKQTQEIKNQLTAIYERNLALIKTIPTDTIERYKQSLLNSVDNLDQEAIIKQAREISNISQRRAKTIARDQTAKAVAGYNQARVQQLNFEYYQWQTAEDERVSTGKGGHKQLNGRIYKYSEPTAIIDTKGTRGSVGQRVNCRCIALPVIIEPNQQVKKVKDSKNGDYYIIVEK